jgi:hypothetical protein
MDECQKVDISVVDVINNLIKTCTNSEEFWMKNEDVPVEYAFLLFHASRNIRLIFEKMKERFICAEKKHENPQVVTDSLRIFPLLNSLCYTVFSLRKIRLNSKSILMVSQRLRLLRKMALETSMFPSPEEELKELDRAQLRKRFRKFADNLQAMFVEI